MKEDLQQLFKDVETAFNIAPIKKYAEDNNVQWHYSISSTWLQKNAIAIIGFNWGAARDKKYDPQADVPAKTFKELYDENDLGSFQRIYKPLSEYFSDHDIENCIQTNFCFFRSAKESQITPGDLELSTPLFEKLMQVITPKKIVGFSNSLRNYFLRNKLCSSEQSEKFQSNNKILVVSKGTYHTEHQETPIYFLPHPNARYTTEARKNAWQFCFSKPFNDYV